MSQRREAMTRHKDEQFNEVRVKEDVRFDNEIMEYHDLLMDPQVILKIENAKGFYILRDNAFVTVPEYSLFGVKFSCFFALGANKLTYRYEGPDYIVVTNQLTKEVIKFVTGNSAQEVLKNVV